MSKRFHLKSSFRSWDNQILTFQIFKCHDVTKCPSMKHETSFTEFIVHEGVGGCDGQLSNFSEHLYGRDKGQIAVLGENWHFRWGRFFFRLELKISFTKNSENKSQAKKNDSDCNFYNFWLLVPCPNKFVVVCICTVIFHGIYSLQPTDIFVGG